MTREEAIKILAVLTAAYPHSYKSMTEEEANGVVMVWSIQFADVPADIVFMAVNKAISSCKFPPSISEVKECLKSLYWDIQTLLVSECTREEISKETLAEYQRICDFTKQFKYGKPEPDLKGLLLNTSKQYLIERKGKF